MHAQPYQKGDSEVDMSVIIHCNANNTAGLCVLANANDMGLKATLSIFC